MQVTDAAQSLGVVQATSIALRGEAYAMELGPLEAVTGGIDFGALRVVDDASRQLTLRNSGKYEVGFKFEIGSAGVREVIEVVPDAGSVAPGKEVVVQVRAGGVGMRQGSVRLCVPPQAHARRFLQRQQTDQPPNAHNHPMQTACARSCTGTGSTCWRAR